MSIFLFSPCCRCPQVDKKKISCYRFKVCNIFSFSSSNYLSIVIVCVSYADYLLMLTVNRNTVMFANMLSNASYKISLFD